MHFKHLAPMALAALGALAAVPAAAQDCAGFTDVLASNPTCANIEWVKNRSITVGCTAAPAPLAYCPNDFVTRQSMAAFLNRLGTALTPTILRVRNDTLGAQDVTTQKQFCETAATAINGYPRMARVRGVMNLFTPTGGAGNNGLDAKAWVVYSTDNGATWLNPPAGDGYAYGALYEGRTPTDDITLNPYNVIDLNVGSSYRFAIAVQRTAGTATTANLYCENLVELVSRNGTSTPFDAPSPALGGRGD